MTPEQGEQLINLVKGLILVNSVGLGLALVSLVARAWNKVD